MASNIQPTGLDWKNLPDKTTPLSAENLNKMANTIDDLVEAVNPLNTVEANPEGTPTEGPEKVEIDGTLYEVKGGHKILNDSGSTLTQKDNLQFKGTYVEDDQTNNKTVVNVTRQMTLAEFNQLTAEQKKGLIDVTDQQGHSITASDVPYDSNTSVKDKIDGMFPKSALKRTNETVTTFSDGAFAVPNINPTNQILLNIDGVGMLFMFRYTEQNQYVGVAYNNNLQPISSQSINIRLTYIDLSEY